MIQYYFTQLSQAERGAYSEFYTAVNSFRSTVSVSKWQLTLSGIGRAFYGMVLDHPEIIWISNRLEMRHAAYNLPGGGHRNLVEQVTITYSMSREEAYAQTRAVQAAEKPFLRELSRRRRDPWGVVEWLHDALIYQADYDQAEKIDGRVRRDNHTIYGVLVKHQGVCEGYAETMSYLLQQVGIPCITCMGGAGWEMGMLPTEDCHAWNCVTIGGKSMQLDTTWDDLGNHNRENGITHQYYGLTEGEMSACHGFSSAYPLPRCDYPELNYFRKRRLMVSSVAQAQALVGLAANRKASYVEFLVTKRSLIPQLEEKRPGENPGWFPKHNRTIARYRWFQPNPHLGWVRVELEYR
jgi:hypothetical protein